MNSRTYLALSFLLLVSSLAGGYTESGNSFSSGGTSVSGGGRAHASGSGMTRASVKTRTSVSSSGKPKTTTTTSTTTGSEDTASTETTRKRRGGSRGKKKGKTTEEVILGDGTSISFSSASGTGSVRASSSASSTSTHSTGTASTTVGGTTRTVTRSRGGTGTEKSTGYQSYEQYPVCRGMAYFKCCSDRKFETINGEVYCGCFGDKPNADFCSFLQLNSEPLVVQDIFGASSGEICVCAENRSTTNEIVDSCKGTVKRECCDQFNGDKKCRCKGDTCAYTRVSNKPLIWKSRTSNRLCVCE